MPNTTGQRIGYARTSTADQIAGLEAQVAELNANGIDRLFKEQVSSVAERAELDAALAYVRDGDTFIVTKLDRLARSMFDLQEITKTLERKGVDFVVLDQAIDTTTPAGRLTFHLLGAVAEFERDLIAERRTEGIAHAKGRGVKFGRREKLTASQLEELKAARRAGESRAALMKRFAISKSSFYRLTEGIVPASSEDLVAGEKEI